MSDEGSVPDRWSSQRRVPSRLQVDHTTPGSPTSDDKEPMIKATSTTEGASAEYVTSMTEFTSLAAGNEIRRSVAGPAFLTTSGETTRVDDRRSRIDVLGSLKNHI